VKIFSTYGKSLGEIAGGIPPLESPCGVAFSSDAKTIYIVQNGRLKNSKSIQKRIRKKKGTANEKIY
jgi:hypothetical protein